MCWYVFDSLSVMVSTWYMIGPQHVYPDIDLIKGYDWLFITRDSEVIMFWSCVFTFFVRAWLCLSKRFNYKGLVPHQQFLLEYRWGYLVVKIMCYIHMTSLMTSPGKFLIVQRGNKYWHDMWFILHRSNTLKFQFRFERSSEVESRNCFREFSKSVFCTW